MRACPRVVTGALGPAWVVGGGATCHDGLPAAAHPSARAGVAVLSLARDATSSRMIRRIPGRPTGGSAHVKRIVLGIAGLLSAALGLIGVFLPVLPTMPLLLLAAFCLTRSSERLYRWLEHTRAYRAYVMPFRETGGIAHGKKVRILGVSYAVMLVSAVLVRRPLVWALLTVVAVFLLWLMLVRIPTVEEGPGEDVAR